MKLPTTRRAKFLWETFSLFFLFQGHLLALKYFQNFDFYGETGIRWLAFLISACPLLLCNFILRTFSGPVFAVCLTVCLEMLLSVAHKLKVTTIHEALYWGDIVHSKNIELVINYLKPEHYWMLLGVLIVIIVSFVIDRKISKPFSKMRPLYLGLSLIILPLVFIYHFIEAENPAANRLKNYFMKRDVRFFAPDWVRSSQAVGLPSLLAHTSLIKIPKPANQRERKLFHELENSDIQSANRAQQIIFVLCESCWHDGKNFSDSFQPLRERGFSEFRAISPVYGGSTANASFEVLTGLPSRTKYLDGVIYQEYGPGMSSKVHAIPNHLKKIGYKSTAIHNFDKYFWHRHIVNPKFGFDKFVGLQDIKQQVHTSGLPSGGWPPDSLLYSTALENLEELKDAPFFLYLTTVYSHGPYPLGNDLGESSYRAKLNTAMSELTSFIDQVSKKYPDALILIFGDHKPALNELFKAKGILSAQVLDSRVPWDPIGDVPVFIRAREKDKVQRLINTASGLPFFCMFEAVDREFINSGIPALKYSRQNKLCEDYAKNSYPYYQKAYPEWLYSLSLFDGGRDQFTLRLHSLLDF